MIYGPGYDTPGCCATTCPTCLADVRDTPEAISICPHCEAPLADCCVTSNYAAKCEYCLELHCAEHLHKTDCGMLCTECAAEAKVLSHV